MKPVHVLLPISLSVTPWVTALHFTTAEGAVYIVLGWLFGFWDLL